MTKHDSPEFKVVHYRIGSLEMVFSNCLELAFVHYRIGSLEITNNNRFKKELVHYRIGSLEKIQQRLAH